MKPHVMNILHPLLLTSRYFASQVSKVIIHKSRGEVSLVEQGTIEKVSAAYSKFIIIFLRKKLNFFTFIICNFLVRTLQYF